MTPEARDGSIKIGLLGGFRVELAGEQVAAGGWPRRAAELVQMLALDDGHRLARDQAIEALWPHLEAQAGAANLRKAAHHARQALGDGDAVVLRGGQVALYPDREIETDVERFEAEARSALADNDPAASTAAAASYTGDLLPEARYEEWAQAPRQRLREEFIELLRRSEHWERVVAEEPTDEPAYRALMRRDLAAGRRPAAIRWYGRLRAALRRDLGITPCAETQAIYDECVAGLGLDDHELVGRQLEVARVTELLRGNPAAGPRALIVRGPAGIGKSALCREITRLASNEGWLAISVSATEGASPYAPIASAAELVLAQQPAAIGALGDRARSILGELTPVAASPEPLGRPLTRHEAIGAFRRLLLAAADGAPLTLVVDDAHLADEATIDLMLHLSSSGGAIMVVVLAYREEQARPDLAQGTARLARAGRSVELDLEPLDHDESAELVALAASTPRSAEVVERIVALAEGNPFLVLEAARSPVASIPSLVSTARDAIVARLVDLDEDETEALGRLALVGDTLDPASVVALTGRPEAESFALLDRALGAGTLVVSGARYRFRHELVRQALADGFPPHKRAAVHREMAERLTESGADPGLIARQWLEGGEPARAVDWLLAAARNAVQLGAFDDANALVDRLLEHSPHHEHALCIRAEALDAVGNAEAPAAYATAAEAVGGQAAHELRAKQALAMVKRGDPPGALAVLERVEPSTVDGRLAEALAFCGSAALGFGDPAVGSEKAAAARRLALKSGDQASLVIASWANAAAAHARGDLRNSVQADLHETHALPELATSVFDGQLCITQRLLYGARPYADVIAFADSLAAEAERLGAARGHAFAVTIRGEAKLLAGQLDEADEDLTAGVHLHHRLGAATGEAFSLQRRSEVALARGDEAEAAALLEESLAVARESDVGFHLLDRIYGTKVTAASDPDAGLAVLEEAEDAVRGPIETCPGCRITLAVPAAIAAARGRDLNRADRWIEEADFLANVVMRLPAWYAALDEAKGHRAQTGGDAVAARHHFRTAAAGFRASGQPLDEARCTALAAVSA